MKRITLLAMLFVGTLASSGSLGAQDTTKAKPTSTPLQALQRLYNENNMRLGNIGDQVQPLPNADPRRTSVDSNPLQALQKLFNKDTTFQVHMRLGNIGDSGLPIPGHGKVYGNVNGPDGSPVAGALVTIAGLGDTMTTNRAGYYFFNTVPPGTYSVTVVSTSWPPLSAKDLRVTEGTSNKVIFTLGTQKTSVQASAKIDGTVRSQDKRPVVGATVTIEGLALTTQTNKDGYYFFNNVPASTYTITVFANGYNPQKVVGFRAIEGEARTADFTLGTTITYLDKAGRGDYGPQSQPLMLRFQLLSPTAFKTKDPAMAGLDSLLNEVLKFPGYRLVAQAAIAVDYEPRPTGMATNTSQILRNGAQEYQLSARIDSVTPQGVRVEVTLLLPSEISVHQTPEGKSVETMTKPSKMLLRTKLTVSFGSTVVLGTTQAGPTSTAVGNESTLILTVKPEIRKP